MPNTAVSSKEFERSAPLASASDHYLDAKFNTDKLYIHEGTATNATPDSSLKDQMKELDNMLLSSPHSKKRASLKKVIKAPPIDQQLLKHADPMEGIDWESFTFSLNGVETDAMWLAKTSYDSNNNNNRFVYDEHCCLKPFGMLHLSPAATVLNYGQGLFEGVKAFRRANGTIVMFRPQVNAERMQQGASRFCLPQVPTHVFVQAADAVVRANARWVPPHNKGALYLRPLLMGTGAALGVNPSVEATFCMYCSPVGNYFKTGVLTAIHLQAVRGYSRASKGGAGSVKAIGNYAPAFQVQAAVKQAGFDEVLCLDAATGECVEEAGASNFFAVFSDNRLVTPSLDSLTILPGVTRRSLLELAEKECGMKVEEGTITLDDLATATEAFCCGTGACITPVGSVSIFDGEKETSKIVFGNGRVGETTRALYDMLIGIQFGTCSGPLAAKYKHWIHVVEP
jgi:branched-chain amino acid aminotransferase